MKTAEVVGLSPAHFINADLVAFETYNNPEPYNRRQIHHKYPIKAVSKVHQDWIKQRIFFRWRLMEERVKFLFLVHGGKLHKFSAAVSFLLASFMHYYNQEVLPINHLKTIFPDFH